MVLIAVVIFTALLSQENHCEARKHDLHVNDIEDLQSEGALHNDTSDYRYFIRMIFNKYGAGGNLSFEGFEHLMGSLGLGNVNIKDHNIALHKVNDKFRQIHDTHDHNAVKSIPDKRTTSPSITSTTLSHTHDEDDNHSNHYHHTQIATSSKHGCMSPKQMLQIIRMNINGTMDDHRFLLVCPILIWELEQQICIQQGDGFERQRNMQAENAHQIYKWVYSTFAVLIISLCGLFSVAVIPIMQKWFYHTLLQFLVGLAVGTLSGDAFLHLLPHAMIMSNEGQEHGGEHSHRDKTHDHLEAMWRGMTALGGIIFFFLAERLLSVLSAYRRRKSLKVADFNAAKTADPVEAHPEPQTCVGEKLSHYRKNSYGMKVALDGKESMQMLQNPEDTPSRRDSRHSSVHEVAFHGRSSFSADPHSGPLYHPVPRGSNPDNYVVTVTEHHGHGHGHSHEVPESVSAVAWMVIMGDGLHNFCDGMAIGAAFAADVSGGISTTVAVFCHELPHELGDFAMLLKTGMRVKQALFYNGLSSILCLIGMLIGVPLGTVDSANSWIFAVTAGMFLYIALVDMLPELAVPSADPSSTPTYTLGVQVLGMSTGVSIMLLIAMFEKPLHQIFS